MSLKEKLKLPETKDLNDLDAVSTTLIHSQIIQKKHFLRKIYTDYYLQFKKSLDSIETPKTIVEIGGGGGFIKKVLPKTITSEIKHLPNVDLQLSATHMPFRRASVDAFLMIDVLHHINDCTAFLEEVNRCLKDGGKLIMVEPANTWFGRFIWTNFHHEPFDPKGWWGLEGEGPLSCANGAIPWIIFERDRKKFDDQFPNLNITQLKKHTPFRYLLSGGLSYKQFLPSFCYSLIWGLEIILSPFNQVLGMFQTIELTKSEDQTP